MARARRGLGDVFSFGGRLPGSVGLVISLTVGLSLLAALGNRHLGPVYEALSLNPRAVWHGQVWRLVTWPFVEPSALGLLFSCLIIFWFGRDLATDWGSRRFLFTFGGVALAAAVGTCIVSLFDRDVATQAYLGSWAVALAMTVAWGLWFPTRTVRLYLVIPIQGYWLAWLTVGLTVVFAVYSGWEHFLPELSAEGAILAWLFRGAALERWAKARRRSRRSAAISPDESGGASPTFARSRLHDSDPPPLPPEIEDRMSDLLGGGKSEPVDDRRAEEPDSMRAGR